ncbi:MAG: family 43 glycosylhydrolase, partial [Clostridium sp.]|nr:family 43 glycosylhydrolase [Clostridium sp.]
ILKKSGHGNFVETDDGEWYMTHLCARYLENKNECILGRETSLQKLEWIDGWPRMIQGDDTPQVLVQAPESVLYEVILNRVYETEFNKDMNLFKEGWMCLRTPFENKINITHDGLIIKGGDSLTSTFDQSLIARKWNSFNITTETRLQFNPYHYSQMAGLTCYYNTKVWYFLYVGYDEKVKKRIVNILVNDNLLFSEPLNGDYVHIDDNIKDIYLKVLLNQDKLQFYYGFDSKVYKKIGPELDSSILSDEHAEGWAYTGAVNGITAVDVFNKDTSAKFIWFKQEDNELPLYL